MYIYNIYLDIYSNGESYVARKTKSTYNLKQMEYLLVIVCTWRPSDDHSNSNVGVSLAVLFIIILLCMKWEPAKVSGYCPMLRRVSSCAFSVLKFYLKISVFIGMVYLVRVGFFYFLYF